ncbi:hypothetical protein PWT90_07022 [Aphanocladium album]|nr:hypothetical protein PWT90_07022 [Aphanocladium album]
MRLINVRSMTLEYFLGDQVAVDRNAHATTEGYAKVGACCWPPPPALATSGSTRYASDATLSLEEFDAKFARQ